MQPYLELINYLTPPAINFKAHTATSTRRRMFGGTYPPEFVGNSFRIFGGHDYGYLVPRTSFNGDLSKIMNWTKQNTWMGFAVTFALAMGNYTLFGPWAALKIFAFFTICNEIYSDALGKLAKTATYEDLLATYTQLERTVGLGLDAGASPQQLAQSRFAGLQRNETRFTSGSSMLFGGLAGFGVATGGLFLWDSILWPSRKAALSYGVGNAIALSFLWMWYQEYKSGVKTGIAHDKHFYWLAFGYLTGAWPPLKNLLV